MLICINRIPIGLSLLQGQVHQNHQVSALPEEKVPFLFFRWVTIGTFTMFAIVKYRLDLSA